MGIAWFALVRYASKSQAANEREWGNYSQVQAPDGMINNYLADVTTAMNYYPFGSIMPGRSFNSGSYRYGFSGHENIDEVQGSGNVVDMGDRWLDTRLGRTPKIDRKANEYPSISPYAYALNTPIQAYDPDGEKVFFTNMSEAQKVSNDLNTIYETKYGVENAFSIQKRVTETQIRVNDWSWSDPSTWGNMFAEPKYKTVETVDYQITTNSEFDWNMDKYTKATFDVFNTEIEFKGDIVPASSKVNRFATISDAKGYSFKSKNTFWLSSDLNVAKNTDLGKFNSKWNFGGTTLHELVNHFHPLGDKEDNRGLQNHFGLPRSRMTHYGGVETEWTGEEMERLNELRSKTGASTNDNDTE